MTDELRTTRFNKALSPWISSTLFLGGSIVGSMYGGPVGGLLLGSVAQGFFSAINDSPWEGTKLRWQNVIDVFNPFSKSIASRGPGVWSLTRTAMMYSAMACFGYTSYFAPYAAPYFVDWISKPFQAKAAEVVGSIAVAKVIGVAMDQVSSDWQQMIVNDREKRAELLDSIRADNKVCTGRTA